MRNLRQQQLVDSCGASPSVGVVVSYYTLAAALGERQLTASRRHPPFRPASGFPAFMAWDACGRPVRAPMSPESADVSAYRLTGGTCASRCLWRTSRASMAVGVRIKLYIQRDQSGLWLRSLTELHDKTSYVWADAPGGAGT
jgi:hypothetical protein